MRMCGLDHPLLKTDVLLEPLIINTTTFSLLAGLLILNIEISNGDFPALLIIDGQPHDLLVGAGGQIVREGGGVRLLLLQAGSRPRPEEQMIIVLLLGVPFLVYLYFPYHLFDTHELIDFDLEVLVLLVALELVLLFLREAAADAFAAVLVELEGVDDEVAPGVVLVGDVEEDGGLLEFAGDLAGDEVDGVNVALGGHAGGVEEDVFAVAEGLDEELQELVDVVALRLEELRVDHQADYLLQQAVHDVVPPVLRQAPLRPHPRTCTASRIYTRDTYSRTSGALSP